MIRLYNGDCLQILKDISSNSVDLVICDLPFGCLTNKNHADGTPGESKGGIRARYIDGKDTGTKEDVKHIDVCSWDVPIDLEKFWEQVRRIRKDDHTPCLHFCTTKYGYELIKSNEKEFRYDLVWSKNRGVSFLSANKMPMRSHEMVYVFSKAGAYYNRVDISGDFQKWEHKQEGYIQSQTYHSTDGSAPVNGRHQIKRLQKDGGDGKRCVLSVIENPTSSGSGKHPTEKPVELYKFLIQRYCPAGGVVLDPTFGSGNSGVACKQLGRKYIGIEKDKTFFDKAKSKLE